MLQDKRVRLLLAALMLLLTSLACAEHAPPTSVGQVTPGPPTEERATATTQPAATEAPTEEPTAAATEVGETRTHVVYDRDHTTDGLMLDSGGDVDTEIVSVGSPPEQAHRTGNGEVLPSGDGNRVEDYYMQFRVDDDFIFRGSPSSRVQIEIEYLDQGTDTFNIQYDAITAGAERGGGFRDTGVVVKTDSGEFDIGPSHHPCRFLRGQSLR
jgi:hypothetical protein